MVCNTCGVDKPQSAFKPRYKKCKQCQKAKHKSTPETVVIGTTDLTQDQYELISDYTNKVCVRLKRRVTDDQLKAYKQNVLDAVSVYKEYDKVVRYADLYAILVDNRWSQTMRDHAKASIDAL